MFAGAQWDGKKLTDCSNWLSHFTLSNKLMHGEDGAIKQFSLHDVQYVNRKKTVSL